MASTNRIYIVTGKGATHLVQAASQAQALRHVAGKEYIIEIAKAIDVAKIMSAGSTIEIAVPTSEQLDLIGE
jgi:hypothetical protein